MKSKFSGLYALLLIVSGWLPAQDLLTWTSVAGHQFKGTFVKMTEDTVTLSGEDGSEVVVSLQAMDEASRQQAQAENLASGNGAVAFTHANRNFRFSLHPSATFARVQFLENGKLLEGGDKELRFTLRENLEKNKSRGVGVDRLLEPVENRNGEVTMRVRMKNGTVIRFVAEVNDKTAFAFSFLMEDPPPGLPPMSLYAGIGFPKLLSYDRPTETYKGPLSAQGVPFEKLPEVFKDYRIEVSQGKETNKIDYHVGRPRGFSGNKMRIVTPAKKNLEIDASSKDGGQSLSTYFYGGKAPFEGFGIRLNNRDKHKSPQGKFSLEMK